MYEGIDASRRFLALFSQDYVDSKICLEEFFIALHRRRDTGDEIVFPVYVYSAELPTYMARWSTTRTAGKAMRAGCRAACLKLLS